MLKVHSTKIASNERCFYTPDGIVKFEGFLMGCFSDCISTKFSTYARNGVLRHLLFIQITVIFSDYIVNLGFALAL